MPTSAEETAKLLDEALALMNNEGAHWHQGDYASEVPEADGRYAYCSLGALRKVRLGDAFDIDYTDKVLLYAEETLASVLPNEFDNRLTCIVEWNDDEERTWDEVVEAFTKAKETVLATTE